MASSKDANNADKSSFKLRSFIMMSAVSHMLFLACNYFELSSMIFKKKPVELPSIEVEIHNTLGSALSDGIKNTKKADTIRVQKNILPQLPANTSIYKKADDLNIKNDALIKTKKTAQKKKLDTRNKTNNKDFKTDKNNQSIKGQKAKITKKLNTKANNQKNQLSQKQKAYNRLKKQQALERLLKEKARQEKKFAKNTQSPKVTKTQSKKSNLTRSTGISSNNSSVLAFSNQVQLAIKKYYTLPELFKFSQQMLSSSVRIELDEYGDILSMDIAKSSGDKVFDALSKRAINQAAPLPIPPKQLVRKFIIIHFAPFNQ